MRYDFSFHHVYTFKKKIKTEQMIRNLVQNTFKVKDSHDGETVDRRPLRRAMDMFAKIQTGSRYKILFSSHKMDTEITQQTFISILQKKKWK